jgi:hypothetical protein
MITTRTIFKSLLAGNCIMKRHGNKHPYCVYDAKMNPLYHISRKMYKRLYSLIKTDKKGRITLNLSKVRQLHGNDYLKLEYKLFNQNKKKQDETKIV